MQHVACPPMMSEDADRMAEEFPRWLEKVSSRVSGGIVLVIDAVDCCQVCVCLLARCIVFYTCLYSSSFGAVYQSYYLLFDY